MEVMIYDCSWMRENGPKSHALLRQAVEDYLGEPVPEFTVLRPGEYGKPYLFELPQVHFSVSHAGGYWICAVSDGEVGLDLQDIRERIAGTGSQEERVRAIARRFFHPSEIAWLDERPVEEFFRVWAKKESYVKYTGRGIAEGFDSFSVVDDMPVMQREIPFAEGYILVLTTEHEAQISRKACPAPPEEEDAGEENEPSKRRRGLFR